MAKSILMQPSRTGSWTLQAQGSSQGEAGQSPLTPDLTQHCGQSREKRGTAVQDNHLGGTHPGDKSESV